ncbi:MAG: response regulator [Planctomycetota bacterium]|jgi:two-component system, chemotaxis family, chemotaxis protein CheY
MALNILIVDDSAVTRAVILKTLVMSGIPIGQTRQAANGREGLDVLEKEWIDLVFVDINMPVMNGEEMIEHVRANPLWKDIPLVVVSTEGSETRIDRLQANGAKFVHKPFTPELIRDVVEEIVRYKANEAQ